jgi:uncharacterized DUF497 family protein
LRGGRSSGLIERSRFTELVSCEKLESLILVSTHWVVSRDPYVIEFDDLDAVGELRFNAIGLVDGRMLFVTYTMRGDVVRIISARGAEPHEKRKYHEI